MRQKVLSSPNYFNAKRVFSMAKAPLVTISDDKNIDGPIKSKVSPLGSVTFSPQQT